MGRAILGFQVEGAETGFSDDLNNSSVHTNWTQEPGGTSTITEDGTDLTISDPGGSTLEWHTSYNAPNINLAIEPVDFTVKVYVSGLTGTGVNGGGIAHYKNGTESNYHSIEIENWGVNDLIVTRSNTYSLDSVDLGSAPGQCWLAMARRGTAIVLYYSTNAVGSEPAMADMTFAREFTTESFDYHDTRVALFSITEAAGYPALAIEFRKFRLTYP